MRIVYWLIGNIRFESLAVCVCCMLVFSNHFICLDKQIHGSDEAKESKHKNTEQRRIEISREKKRNGKMKLKNKNTLSKQTPYPANVCVLLQWSKHGIVSSSLRSALKTDGADEFLEKDVDNVISVFFSLRSF